MTAEFGDTAISETWRLVGKYQKQQLSSSAAVLLRQLINALPDDAARRPHLWRAARLCLDLADVESGRAFYRQYYEIERSAPDVTDDRLAFGLCAFRSHLADYELMNGDLTAAERLAQEALSLLPPSLAGRKEAARLRGQCHAVLGDCQAVRRHGPEATAAYRRAHAQIARTGPAQDALRYHNNTLWAAHPH